MMVRFLLVFCVLLGALPARFRAGNASCSSSYTGAIALSKIPPQKFIKIAHLLVGLTLFLMIAWEWTKKSEDDIVNSIIVGQRDLLQIQEMVEAHDLIKKSLSSTREERPSAKGILQHPFFWNAEERLSFMAHFSEYVEKGEPTDSEAELNMLRLLSNIAPETRVHQWMNKIPPRLFISDIHNLDRPIHRYGNTVYGLLRFIRNKFIHFARIKDDIKEQLGIQSVEALAVSFRDLFPNSLIHVHMVTSEKLSHDKYFSKYFSND